MAKVEDAAKEIVRSVGKDWEQLDERDKIIYKNIARAILLNVRGVDMTGSRIEFVEGSRQEAKAYCPWAVKLVREGKVKGMGSKGDIYVLNQWSMVLLIRI